MSASALDRIKKAQEERKKREEEAERTGSTENTANTSVLSRMRELQAKRFASEVPGRLGNYSSSYNDVMEAAKNRFTESAGQKYRSSDSANKYVKTLANQTASQAQERAALQHGFNTYGKYVDEEVRSKALEALKQSSAGYSSVANVAAADKQYRSRFKSEQEYNDAINAAKTIERRKALDLKAERTTLDSAKAQYDELAAERDRIRNGYVSESSRRRYAVSAQDLAEKDAKYQEIDNKIAALTKEFGGDSNDFMTNYNAREREYNLSQTLQDTINMENTAKADKNFSKYSASDVDKELADQDVSLVFRAKIPTEASKATSDDPKFWECATDEQKKIYSYYKGEAGEDAANKYKDAIANEVNYKRAQAMFDFFKGNTLKELAFSVVAGLDQFSSGVESLFNDHNGYGNSSATQQLSDMIRKDLADNGPKILGTSLAQGAYDLGTTTTNMVPSILTSALVSSVATPGAGAIAGAALLGSSAGGNAYNEMIQLGYNEEQAKAYGMVTAASEAGLQYALGGISKLGGKASGSVIDKAFAEEVNNSGMRAILKFGGNMVSEGTEEFLQDVLNPFFKKYISGDTSEKVDWGEALYSGILGALSAGVFEGSNNVANTATNVNAAKQLKKQADGIDNLKAVGNTFSADSVAYKLAEKIDKNSSTLQIAKAMREVHANLSDQNIATIEQALVSKGMSENVAKINAKWLAKAVNGETFTTAQRKALECNDVIADVFRTEIIDANSTVNQRIMAYAKMKATAKKASVNAKNQNAENVQTDDTATTQSKPNVISQYNAKQDLLGAADKFSKTGSITNAETNILNTQKQNRVSDNGKTFVVSTGEEANIDDIVDVKKGELIYKMDNGQNVSSKDISYSTSGEAVVFETLASTAQKYNMSPMSVKALARGYSPESGISESDYIIGALMAYRYGTHNIKEASMDKNGSYFILNNVQRKIAYEAGVRDAETNLRSPSSKKKTTAAKTPGVKISVNKTLSSRQKVSVEAIDVLAKALGIQVDVYESKVDKNGKRIGANGWYQNGEIHVDLFAGNNGEQTMLYTVSHELLHFIKDYSPAKYKALADFLMEEYGKKGVSVDDLVKLQMVKARKNGHNLSYDDAFEEVVADSMQSMLTDTDAISKIQKLKAQDKGLVEKIKEFFDNLLKNIKKEYAAMNPDTQEGQLVSSMVDSLERLSELFAEGVVDASNNLTKSSKAEKNTTSETDSETKFMLRGVRSDGIEVYETNDDIKKLPYTERKKEFIRIMDEEFKGRTAKFIRNGHSYYATFEEDDINKNVYGDKKSDKKGFKAKINIGASGDIFEFVENALYNGSNPESGKTSKAHKGVNYWDYFIKTVQIDNKGFDLVANIRKKPAGNFVYSLQLRENKKIGVAPLIVSKSNTDVKSSVHYSNDTKVPQNETGVKSSIRNNSQNDIGNGEERLEIIRGIDDVRFSGRGNGYIGHSMSVNASRAYDDGEMPLSKWTKNNLVNALQDLEINVDISKLTLDELRDTFLKESSWHHTGAFYSAISFYSVNENVVESITQDDINRIVSSRKANVKKTEEQRREEARNHQALIEARAIDKQLDVILGSGLAKIKTKGGLLKRYINNNLDVDSLYSQAIDQYYKNAKPVVEGWRKLPKEHWRQAYVELYDVNKERFVLKTLFDEKSINSGSIQTIKKYLLSDNKNTTSETDGGVKYKLREGVETDVDKALQNKNYTEDVYLTENSPTIISSQKNTKNLPMLMKASHMRENIFTEEEAKKAGLKVNSKIHYHGLGKALFLEVIDSLDDVSLAYRGTKTADDTSRRENFFLLITKLKHQGDTIVVPIYIDEIGQYNRVFIDTNKIASVYGKEGLKHYLETEVSKGNLVRVKNKSTQASELRADIANSYSKSASIDINVPQNETDVNNSLRRNLENDTKHSERNASRYSELAKDPHKNKTELDKIVEETAKANGYTEKVYHGTVQFGFTNIDVSQSDDGNSFFATDDLETAKTYSSYEKVRGVSEGQEENPYIRSLSNQAYNLVEKCNRLAGFHSFVDYGDNIFLNAIDAIVNNDKYWEYDFNDAFDELLYRIYESSGVDDDFDSFFRFTEVEELFYEAEYFRSSLIGFSSIGDDGVGNYQFYANLDNVFEVDAKGNPWNSINVKDLGYRTTTRDIAYYAKDNGYSGVKITNVVDDGGKGGEYRANPSTVYVFFNPQEQLKSADTVTYDDKGNIVPLDERFNNKNDDIRYSDRHEKTTSETDGEYSYDNLISKSDMKITIVNNTKIQTNRADILVSAKKNATKIGKYNSKDGSVSVYVNDLNSDVILAKRGLIHGLQRMKFENIIATIYAGETLKNAIRINELSPKKDNVSESYVLIGFMSDKAGRETLVRFVVNKYTNELDSMDVLYSISGRNNSDLSKNKGTAVLDAPLLSRADYRTTISIKELLNIVNKHYPGILPKDVLRRFGYTERPKGDLGQSALYSERSNTSVSNRSLLANALETTAKNDVERKYIADYKANINQLNEYQKQLSELNSQIKEISFGKGKRDMVKLRTLKEEAVKTANRINIMDKKLLRLESSKVLQGVVEHEKKAVQDKMKALAKEQHRIDRENALAKQEQIKKHYQESRRKNVEGRKKTVVKHKILDKMKKLSNLLLKETAEKHIPFALKTTTIEALTGINSGKVSYTPKAALGNYYGVNIQGSIKEFQRRTGLVPDGCIGPKTLANLKKYGLQ